MVSSMATTKVTVTLQDDQLQKIRALVAAGQAGSVSGFVQHAVTVALFDAAGWNEMLTHRARLKAGEAVDAEILTWLRAAYDAAAKRAKA